MTSGLLAVFAFCATLFLQVARTTALALARGPAAMDLAVESALHWGVSRLAREPVRFDAPRTAAARADDWQFRDGTEYRWLPGGADATPSDLAETANPSFARGEPWTDGNGDGRYDPGEDWTDLDGDGRYSVWSGRLRGGKGPFGRTFSLRIEPGASSRVNVNGGHPRKSWSPSSAWGFRGIPPDSGNDQIVCHLNLLGAALGVRDYEIANVDNPMIKPVKVSDLGEEIVSRRPPGGYGSRRDLERVLVDGGVVTPEAWRLLSPHLALGETRNAAGRIWLDVNGAPRAVLASFWMHRTGGASSPYLSYAGNDLLIGGETVQDPWTQASWSGTAFVFPEEAGGMAGTLLLAKRSAGLLEDHPAVFRALWDGLRAGGHLCPDDGATPVSEPGLYATEKARLLMAASFPDAVTQNGWSGGFQKGRFMSVLPSVGSWEWDPDGVPENDIRAVNLKTTPTGMRIVPIESDGYHGTSPYAGLTGFQAAWPDRAFWLGPLRDFLLSAVVQGGEGRVARSADVSVLTVTCLNSQEDFENLGTVRTGDDPNTGRIRLLPGGIEARGISRYNDVQSLPDFSKRSYWISGMAGFNESVGALTLAEAAASDFPAFPPPTATVTMDPHVDGNETLVGNWLDTTRLDGQDHARLKGAHVFADNGPDLLFAAGEAFEVHPSQMSGGSKPLYKCDPCWTGNVRTYRFSLEEPGAVPAPLRAVVPLCPASVPHPDLARMWDAGGIEAWVDFTLGTVWQVSADFMFGPGLVRQQSLALSRGDTQYVLEWTYDLPVIWNDVNGNQVVDIGDTYWLASSGDADNRLAWDLPARSAASGRPFPDHIVVEWRTLRYVPNRGNLDAMEVRSRLRVVMNGIVVHDAVHRFARDSTGPFMPIMSRRIAADGRFDSHLEVECVADQMAIYNVFGAGDFRIGAPRPCRDRFAQQGWYESPLFVLPVPMRPLWAAWAGVASEAVRARAPGAMRCWLVGYGDAAGASRARTEEIEGGGRSGERLDFPRTRSFRFRVAWSLPDDDAIRDVAGDAGGTGAFIDPPVFEEFRIASASTPRWGERE